MSKINTYEWRVKVLVPDDHDYLLSEGPAIEEAAKIAAQQASDDLDAECVAVRVRVTEVCL